MVPQKGFMKTTKKCENKNLTLFLFQYNFQKCTGREGLKQNIVKYKLVKKYLKELYKKNCFGSCRVRVMLRTLINVSKQTY